MTLPAWSPRATALWAKSGDESGFLSLPQHLMDSAGVAGALWDTWLPPGEKDRIAEGLSLTPEQTRSLAIWLAATHDVGKASKPFQSQLGDSPEHAHLCDAVRATGLSLPYRIARQDGYPHALAGEHIIRRWLGKTFSMSRRDGPYISQSIAAIAGAHHGLPNFDDLADHRSKNELLHEDEETDRDWWQVQEEILERITAFTGAGDVLAWLLKEGPEVPQDIQMLLTGFVIVTDWIASNSDLHPYLPRGTVRTQEEFTERLARGVEELDLPGPWRPNIEPDGDAAAVYRKRFNWPEDQTPRPLQTAALAVARSMQGPGILVVEGPMGVGKTEAALVAGETLAQTAGSGGMIFAAPTMATSDALFTRVLAWARSAGGPEVQSMYLGHSKNTLNREFGSIPRRAGTHPGGGMGIAEGEEEAEPHAEVIAHQWLWGRKKGILANFVVGTVDQVLFLALQAKHAMLRHLGLAGKVVVIDEVHAYDAYMSEYLATSLEWLGSYGAPVVLLSATLPQQTKQHLVAAYMAGLTERDPSEIQVPATGSAYPVLTSGTAEDGVRAHAVEASAHEQSVAVKYLPDDDASLVWVLSRVREEGGCLLVLCNTVPRAQHAYTLAREHLETQDVRLLHARFVTADRVRQERELVADLGPQARRSDGTRPARRVVVATQVVEQSLDLDFDAMITDVAPVDLLLQRMGRVHRHQRSRQERPAWARTPTVQVRGLRDPGNETTPPEFVRDTTLIYPEALLLSTWAQLREHLGGPPVILPRDIPDLVRRAYAPHPGIPSGWEERFRAAQKDHRAFLVETRNKSRAFRFPAPLDSEVFRDLWDAQRQDVSEVRGAAQVRDTDPTLEVVLMQGDDAYTRPLPWLAKRDGRDPQSSLPRGSLPGPGLARLLATSTVRLPHRFSYSEVFNRAVDQLERTTDEAWQQSMLLKGQLQLILDDELRTELAGVRLRYDPELGLIDESSPDREPEETA